MNSAEKVNTKTVNRKKAGECRNLALEEFMADYGHLTPGYTGPSLFQRRFSGPYCIANFGTFINWKNHNIARHDVAPDDPLFDEKELPYLKGQGECIIELTFLFENSLELEEENASADQEIALAVQEIAPADQEIAPADLEIAPAAQEIASMPQEIAPAAQEIAPAA